MNHARSGNNYVVGTVTKPGRFITLMAYNTLLDRTNIVRNLYCKEYGACLDIVAENNDAAGFSCENCPRWKGKEIENTN